MESQKVNKLATIVTRYAELNSAAKQAALLVSEVRYKAFSDILTDDESYILERAQRILENLQNNTTQYDAVKFCEKVFDEKK